MNNIQKLNSILDAYKIPATCMDFIEHKNACFYDIALKPGGKVKDLEKYSMEFSLALKSANKPQINILPENGLIRFEFLKNERIKSNLLDLGKNFIRPKGGLTCLMGETLTGEPVWVDLSQNPHMLVAGCSGSGKSTALHTIIANLMLYSQVQIKLMDPKNIEFFKYSDSRIKNIDVSYSYEECLQTLNELVVEMEDRYYQIKTARVDIKSLPYIVLVIDEFADLKMQDSDGSFVRQLTKLAQKSRAAKIHIILATQRPSVNVIDGVIKANFPSRLSCKVASGVDSKVVLDTVGAENLIGLGDSIINNYQFAYQRFQVAYTDPNEACEIFAKYGKRR